jgi:hypothetical protein
MAFMAQNPDTPVVEMDNLTIHFTDSKLMLAFLRDANNAQSVADVFDELYSSLGSETFESLFQIQLTDNGSEFSNPKAIEFNSEGEDRTRVFYCDPRQSQQKGAYENNHEMIRRIVPKGRSFDNYSQADIMLMMSHINCYARKALNGRSPYDTFSFMHGEDVLMKLGAAFVAPDDVTLRPSLLRQHKSGSGRQGIRPTALPPRGWNLPFQKNGHFPLTHGFAYFLALQAEFSLLIISNARPKAQVSHIYTILGMVFLFPPASPWNLPLQRGTYLFIRPSRKKQAAI